MKKQVMTGEPSGTAGAPILNILQKKNLVNCLVVVTRYFGGILLGTGGLSRAYSESAKAAIEKVNISKLTLATEYEIKLKYSQIQNFENYCRKNNIKILKSQYNEDIVCNILVNNELNEIFLKNAQENEIEVKKIKEEYMKI